VHVRAAETLAKACADAGIKNLVHISALGADTRSDSDYARTKGEGEALIRKHVPSANILRPSIVFGPEDNFFNQFAAMTSFSPALPLIGGGQTKFQPIYAGDVGEAVATCLRKRLLAPLPWFVANIIGFAGEVSATVPFVAPFLTRDQVKLLKILCRNI